MAKSFFQLVQRIWISKFVCIPGKVRIENDANVFPVVVSWLFKLQRPLGMVYEWSAPLESSWLVPHKFTCISSKIETGNRVTAVTVACSCFGSCLWGIGKVYGWSKHKLIQPNFRFESYGSFGSLENMESEFWFLLVLVLFLMFKQVLNGYQSMLDIKDCHGFP